MSRAQCLTPLAHPKIIGMLMPCRKCHQCVKFTRLEWANRMKMECFENVRPFFTTWTFAPDVYTNSEADCKADIQRFWKKLRRAGHDLRYFTVIERGSQKHRLHGHSILWSKSLSALSGKRAFNILKSVWGNGRIDMQQVRSPAGLNYVVKYLVKELSEEKQRNYQWSQKPMLGSAGLKYWEETIHWYHIQKQFDIRNLPPNKITMPIMGGLHDVWIPKSNYLKFCKVLGIDFKQEEYKTPEDWEPLEVSDGKSEAAIYRQAELYRIQQARY